MKVTNKILNDWGACPKGLEWFDSQKVSDGIKLTEKLLKTNELEKVEWANWLVVRLMTPRQNVQYAIYCAKSVLDIFEKEYPKDDRPRKAIWAAENYLSAGDATGDARAAAWAAARAAWAAARAAGAAASAAAGDAGAAAWAAGAAAWAARAAGVAVAAAWAAGAAAWAAVAAGDAAGDAARKKKLTIYVEYGLSIISGEVKSSGEKGGV